LRYAKNLGFSNKPAITLADATNATYCNTLPKKWCTYQSREESGRLAAGHPAKRTQPHVLQTV
jgi:hypothetical protein